MHLQSLVGSNNYLEPGPCLWLYVQANLLVGRDQERAAVPSILDLGAELLTPTILVKRETGTMFEVVHRDKRCFPMV